MAILGNRYCWIPSSILPESSMQTSGMCFVLLVAHAQWKMNGCPEGLVETPCVMWSYSKSRSSGYRRVVVFGLVFFPMPKCAISVGSTLIGFHMLKQTLRPMAGQPIFPQFERGDEPFNQTLLLRSP